MRAAHAVGAPPPASPRPARPRGGASRPAPAEGEAAGLSARTARFHVRHHRPTSIPHATTNMWPSPSARATRFLRMLFGFPAHADYRGAVRVRSPNERCKRSWDDDPRRPVRFALRAPGGGVTARLGIRIRARHALGVRRLRCHAGDQSAGPHPLTRARRRRGADRLRRRFSTGSIRPSGPSAHCCRPPGPSGGARSA